MKLLFTKSLLLSLAMATAAQATVLQKSATFNLNPESLRTRLFKSNLPIVAEMNQVQTAKEQINLARANLLPSLNLGGVISGASGFGLTSVAALLPFLMPSNWYALAESKDLFLAEEDAFQLLQLNTYASALSVYYTIINDQQLAEKLYNQYLNSKQMYDYIKQEFDLGIASQTDLNQSQSQMQTQQVQYSQTKELLVKEIASFRQMLALPLTTQITLTPMHADSSSVESKSAQSLLSQALAISPEKEQMKKMIAAAGEAKWSKFYNFFSGFSLAANRSTGSNSIDFGNISATANANIGFATIPTYKISNLNIQALQIQDQEIDLQQASTLESTLGSLQLALQQLSLVTQSEINLNSVYNSEMIDYRLGLTDLLHVLSASNAAIDASFTKIRTQSDVDNLRVALSRTLILNQFAKIKKCDLSKFTKVSTSPLGGLFHHPANDTLDIDKACFGSN